MFNKENMINRFSTYVKIDTKSVVENAGVVFPSSDNIFDLLNIIKEEMDNKGLRNELDEKGVLYAWLDSNMEVEVPKVGFIAHGDTAPDLTGANVKPQIVDNYDGGIIRLNEEYHLDPVEFPSLKHYVGKTLITTDGTTLLGGDDKAGIAEILEVIYYLIDNPEIKHGQISIAFTPDEEIGVGSHSFDVEKFDADFAYTIDGGGEGELQFESFNAYNAVVTIQGKNVHPGHAKNTMINSQSIAIEFDKMLPAIERPQFTTMYEGFYHLHQISGNEEETKMTYLIRDHDTKIFESRKELFLNTSKIIEDMFPGSHITIEGSDAYYNMGLKVMENPAILEYAKKAMANAGITPIIEPIRGGTDGSQLSFRGLPCPNIFTGVHNLHGRFEYVCVDSMLKASETLYNIVIEVTK